MGAMNVQTNMSFHEQLVHIMGQEIRVELVKGQPVDVHLKGASEAGSDSSKSTAQTAVKSRPKKAVKKVDSSAQKSGDSRRGKGKRMNLETFKQALSENDLDKLKISIYQLPLQVEESIDFLATIEFPVNYADMGNRYKAKYGVRISSLFKNMDNLILFMNFRLEFNVNDLVRDGDIILRQNDTAKSAKKKPIIGGFIGWIKSLFNSN
jgi:hypothetical protein